MLYFVPFIMQSTDLQENKGIFIVLSFKSCSVIGIRFAIGWGSSTMNTPLLQLSSKLRRVGTFDSLPLSNDPFRFSMWYIILSNAKLEGRGLY